MRKHLSFWILLTSCLFLCLPWLSASDGASAWIATHKKETAEKIFRQLIDARGEFGAPTPTLQFVEGDSELARISGQTIFLGEKAYDICTGFGPDSLKALAFLLSHELVHYYESHTWEDEFSRNFASNLSGEVHDSWLKDEVMADLWGGMLAYSAGYQVYEVVPSLFPTLYSAYGKGEDLPGYPKLAERIAMAHETAAKLKTLTDLFETANYLVALEMYEDAAAYYELILLEKYRGREVYNNLGVYNALAALQLFRKAEMPYALPLELDAQSRILASTRGNNDLDDRETKINTLLDKAAFYFETAHKLDPDYLSAQLNAGVVFLLKGAILQAPSPELAEEQFLQVQLACKKTIREAKKAADHHIKAQAFILQGVLAALEQDPDAARAFWEEADPAQHPLAKANLIVLEKGAFSQPVNRLPRTSEREKIEALSLDLFLRQRPLDTLFGFDVKGLKGQWGKSAQRANLSQSHLYYHAISASRFAVIQVTADQYEGATILGLRLGDSLGRLQELYKDPDRVIPLTTGNFFIYGAHDLIVELDTSNRVKRWAVYRMKNLPGS